MIHSSNDRYNRLKWFGKKLVGNFLVRDHSRLLVLIYYKIWILRVLLIKGKSQGLNIRFQELVKKCFELILVWKSLKNKTLKIVFLTIKKNMPSLSKRTRHGIVLLYSLPRLSLKSFSPYQLPYHGFLIWSETRRGKWPLSWLRFQTSYKVVKAFGTSNHKGPL